LNIGLIRMKYAPYGGAEVFLSRFIDELIKKGHTCHLFAAKWDEKSKIKTQNSKLIWHRVKTFGPSFFKIWFFAFNAFLAVRKTPLDVVISFDRTLYQDIYRAGDGCHREWLFQRQKAWSIEHRAWGRNTIKKLITSLNPLHLTILYLEKRLFKSKKLKFVVANSRRGKQEIIRHYNLPEEKIYVIYNGIDINRFDLKEKERVRAYYRERFGISADETVLLFVGSGFERKGLEFLIRAFGLLNARGYDKIKLLVVGKGNEKKYLKLAGRLGIKTDVIFTGHLKDVLRCYFAGDIFVLPSIYEPFSNACLEAMAAGLPVVTSSMNGASEILNNGKDGMVIEDPLNHHEIAEMIKPLLDSDKRNEIGMAARRRAENYTIENNVEGFLKLINRMGVV